MNAMDRYELDRVDVYANHLYLAGFGRTWARRVRGDAAAEATEAEAEYLRGYAQAIDDISAHLEAGEGLPSGPVYTRLAASLREPRNSA